MTLAELITTCNATGIRLGIVESGLRVDAPAGAITAEIREALAEYKPILLAAMVPVDAEREAIQWVESLTPSDGNRLLEASLDELAEIVREDTQRQADADPIFPKLNAWLWRLAALSSEEEIEDAGRRWDVMGTANRLLQSRWSQAWLGELEPFYNAAMRGRSNYPSADDAHAFFEQQRLAPADQTELETILTDFTDAADSKDQARVSGAWDRLNAFNVRTGRAKPCNAPKLGATTHA